MSKDIFGYRGCALKVPFSNFDEKEAIIVEALDKGCYIMDFNSFSTNGSSFLYITGEQQKFNSNLMKLNYVSVDFQELDLSFTGMEYIVDISLIGSY